MKNRRYGKFRFGDYAASWGVIALWLLFSIAALVLALPRWMAVLPAVFAAVRLWAVLSPQRESFILNRGSVTVFRGGKSRTIDLPPDITIVASYADICPPLTVPTPVGNRTHILKDRYAVSILRETPQDADAQRRLTPKEVTMKAANKKRKTVFIPAAGWIPLTCAFFLFCIGALYIVTGFIPLPEEPIVLDYVGSILAVLVMVPVLIFGIFCAVVQFALWCRPIVLTENEMVQGLIFKRRYAKMDITGIGIAPLYSKTRVAQGYTQHGVYAVTGPYDKELIHELGIAGICLASWFRAFWKPKTGQMPDSVCLIGHQLERCSMLKEWLGQAPEE